MSTASLPGNPNLDNLLRESLARPRRGLYTGFTESFPPAGMGISPDRGVARALLGAVARKVNCLLHRAL